MKNIILKYAVFLTICLGCNCVRANNDSLNTPINNFQHLWKFFDKQYSLFAQKKVDWNKVYDKYIEEVNNQMSDSLLFRAMSDMLGELNDYHVNLVSPLWHFNAGRQKAFNDFDFKTIAANYLHNKYTEMVFVPGPGGKQRSLFKSGHIDSNIAHISIGGFRSEEQSVKVLDSLLNTIRNCKGLVLDIRNNGGGADEVAKLLQSRFASEKKLALTFRFRHGNNHSDFTSYATPWYTVPQGNYQYTNPVIVLTNRNTASAAENFELALRTMANVIVIGDTTRGIFSTSLQGRLPNGWEFTCSNALFEDATGICYEGIGIPPDYYIVNSHTDLQNGKDEVLEKAIQILNGQQKIILTRSFSSLSIKQSIAFYIKQTIALNRGDISTILGEGEQRLKDTSIYYYDDVEMFRLLPEFARQEKNKESVVLLEFMFRHSRNSIYTEFLTAVHYVMNNETSKADTLVKLMTTGERFEEVLYDEETVNNSAYILSGAGYNKEALYFFLLNARLHPDSPNVYDSLADFYEKTGNKTKAKDALQHLLKLDPENEDAIKAMETLNKA